MSRMLTLEKLEYKQAKMQKMKSDAVFLLSQILFLCHICYHLNKTEKEKQGDQTGNLEEQSYMIH